MRMEEGYVQHWPHLIGDVNAEMKKEETLDVTKMYMKE